MNYPGTVFGNDASFTNFNLCDWPTFENSILLPLIMRISSFGFICCLYLWETIGREAKGRIESLTRVWDEIGVLIA